MGYTTGHQLVNAGFRNHQVWQDLSASHPLNDLLLSIHDVCKSNPTMWASHVTKLNKTNKFPRVGDDRGSKHIL